MGKPTIRENALPILAATAFLVFGLSGCMGTAGKALESHEKGVSKVFEDEYVVPKKPVDRAYIGCAWSRQFGPVEDPSAPEIRVRKERSLNNIQQEYAYSLGIALGDKKVAQAIDPATGQVLVQAGGSLEAGARKARLEQARMEGVEIVSPVSLADIPFEQNIAYVTEALRLANFRIRDEQAGKIGVAAGGGLGSGARMIGADAGSVGRTGTEGEGLVVAYKLHSIDPASYRKQESGAVPLELDRNVDLPGGGFFVKARLQAIEPGAGKSLPRNLLWACARADAKSRDMVAAWLVDIRPTEPGKKSLTIAFPALPKIEDCDSYRGYLNARIDPATDRIVRQRIQVMILDADVSDALQPARFDARVSLVDESFTVRLVKPSEMR